VFDFSKAQKPVFFQGALNQSFDSHHSVIEDSGVNEDDPFADAINFDFDPVVDVQIKKKPLLNLGQLLRGPSSAAERNSI
jgi:hypothetical protein